MEDFIIKTSGQKKQFSSGATRDSNEGKSRPDLISPYFQERFGHHLAKGGKIHGDRNWEKGMLLSHVMEAMERHLVAVKKRNMQEDNLSAIAFGCMVAIDHLERIKLGLLPKELDDYFDTGLKGANGANL